MEKRLGNDYNVWAPICTGEPGPLRSRNANEKTQEFLVACYLWILIFVVLLPPLLHEDKIEHCFSNLFALSTVFGSKTFIVSGRLRGISE